MPDRDGMEKCGGFGERLMPIISRACILGLMAIACAFHAGCKPGVREPAKPPINLQALLLQAPGGGRTLKVVSIGAGALAVRDIRLKEPVTVTTVCHVNHKVYGLGGEIAAIGPLEYPLGLYSLAPDGATTLLKKITGYSNFGCGMGAIDDTLVIAADDTIHTYDTASGAFDAVTLPDGIVVEGNAGIVTDSDRMYFKTTDGRIAAMRLLAPQEVAFMPAPAGMILIQGVCQGHVLAGDGRVAFPWAAAKLGSRIDSLVARAPGILRGVAKIGGYSWVVSSPEWPTHYAHYACIEQNVVFDVPESTFRSATELPDAWEQAYDPASADE